MPDETDDGSAPLVQPPRLNTGESRTATRLELFFDLAYVLVVAALTGAFADDLTWHGVTVFAGLFTVIWWSWVTITLYANRFDTNDVLHRLAKLGAVFAVAVMAAAAGDAVGADAVPFALGYVATRVLLLVLYARAFRHVVEARGTLSIYAVGAAAGAALWLLSLGFDGTPRYILWAAGVLLEAVAPLLAPRLGSSVPLHREHLPERFGLLTILVLGEAIAGVVIGIHDSTWAAVSVAAGAVGFLITASLWWNYFDLGGAAGKQRLVDDESSQESGTADWYVYGHLPLLLGLAMTAVGIEEHILHPQTGLPAGAGWALIGGVTLYLIGTALVLGGTSNDWRAAWPWPLLALPLVGLIAAFSPAPLVSASLMATVLVLLLLTGIRQQRRGKLETTET